LARHFPRAPFQIKAELSPVNGLALRVGRNVGIHRDFAAAIATTV